MTKSKYATLRQEFLENAFSEGLVKQLENAIINAILLNQSTAEVVMVGVLLSSEEAAHLLPFAKDGISGHMNPDLEDVVKDISLKAGTEPASLQVTLRK